MGRKLLLRNGGQDGIDIGTGISRDSGEDEDAIETEPSPQSRPKDGDGHTGGARGHISGGADSTRKSADADADASDGDGSVEPASTAAPSRGKPRPTWPNGLPLSCLNGLVYANIGTVIPVGPYMMTIDCMDYRDKRLVALGHDETTGQALSIDAEEYRDVLLEGAGESFDGGMDVGDVFDALAKKIWDMDGAVERNVGKGILLNGTTWAIEGIAHDEQLCRLAIRRDGADGTERRNICPLIVAWQLK